MKKNIIMLIAAATMLGCSSCKKINGEGPVETETRNISNFSGIHSAINGKINFRQSPVYSIEIIAQRNVIDMMETYKNGDELVIKFKNNRRVTSGTAVVVNISAPSLESVQLSGSGDVAMQGNVTAGQFNFVVSGSGSIVADHLQVDNTLTARVSGSGNLKAESGSAQKSDLIISGSGSIDLQGLRSDAVRAGISGSGSIRVHAAQTLKADISGSGIVYYMGSPSVTSHISGSGRVMPL
jgi:hypothetical protein